jgi:hypothetical protein
MENTNRDDLEKIIQQLKERIEKLKQRQHCTDLDQIIQEAKRYVENNPEGENADLIFKILLLILELLGYYDLKPRIQPQNVNDKENKNKVKPTTNTQGAQKEKTKSKSR